MTDLEENKIDGIKLEGGYVFDSGFGDGFFGAFLYW
jgi:hypothetical protein